MDKFVRDTLDMSEREQRVRMRKMSAGERTEFIGALAMEYRKAGLDYGELADSLGISLEDVLAELSAGREIEMFDAKEFVERVFDLDKLATAITEGKAFMQSEGGDTYLLDAYLLDTVSPDWRGRYQLDDAIEFFEMTEDVPHDDDEGIPTDYWDAVDRKADEVADYLNEVLADVLSDAVLGFGGDFGDYGLYLYRDPDSDWGIEFV